MAEKKSEENTTNPATYGCEIVLEKTKSTSRLMIKKNKFINLV